MLAAFAGVLALTAQASASGPIAGALGALGATATQQLGAVTHDAPAVPLPAPAAPAPPAANDVTQAADAVPQALATTAATVRASASDVAERARASRPSESAARSETSDSQSGPPSDPGLAAVAERAGRVTPSTVPASAAPARVVPARIVATAHEIVSPAAERVARRLEHTVQGAPVARHLGERATRVAGALIGTVVGIAHAAHDALSALPSLGTVSSLQPTIAPPALSEPRATRSTTTSQPPEGQTPRATSMTAAGLAPAIAAAPIAPGAEHAVPVQAFTSRREAPPNAQARHSAKPSLASRGAQPGTARAKPRLTSGALAPSPTPSPGGVSPASGAGASGGLSASTLLAFAALLLLAGPRAMRRLRLAAGSRRAAQFVLIPERPG
jgi:hypothetical protein